MRILLITPENPHLRAFRRGQTNNFVQLTMPYLAAYVQKPDSVTLVDEYNQRVCFDAPVDLVGITCNTPNARHVYRMADEFRRRGKMVVLGGPHPTLLPEEAAAHADAVVVGEADETWPALLSDARAGRLQPLYRSTSAPSLERLPWARRDLIRGRGWLGSTVVATRGCPHRCSFCNLRQIYHTQLRFRPVRQVADEIRSLPSPIFTFWDDQLFMDPDYAMRLFQELEGVGKRWAAMVTLNSTRNESLLKAASRAGCSCLFLGLESFSPESLRLANKSFNVLETYYEGIERLHRHRIAVQAGVIFGFDGDDLDTFDHTLRETIRVGLDGATVSILTPFPQTPIFEQLRAEGRLLTDDWSYFNGKTAVAFRPARMTPEQLWDGYMRFRQGFFSWRSILRRMGVRPLQALALNWGYRRALGNRIPGHPIPAEPVETATSR